MWKIYALLSAVFAALTAIFAKVGIQNVDSNLATAIRTVVILFVAFGIVFVTGTHAQIPNITKKCWIFLTLSGLSTGASWLFYFRAIQLGKVSEVAVIDKFSLVLTIIFAAVFLHEGLSIKTVAGALLMTAGTILLL